MSELILPKKGTLVEFLYTFSYGPHFVTVGDLGVFLDYTKTDICPDEYTAIIKEFYWVYAQKAGVKMNVPRSDFKFLI